MRNLPLLALCALLLGAPVSRAAEMQKIVQDVQRLTQNGEQITMALWMPPAFWEASMASTPGTTPEARAKVVAALGDYIIFAVLRAKAGLGGTVEASERAELLKNSRLEIGGKVIEPVAPESINPGAQALLAAMKPSFAAMLGNFGKGMELLVYPSHADGKALLDERKPGSFQFTLYEQTYSWRLPLPSLLPPRVDPKTHEEFPGNYQFNPYTGTKLLPPT